VSDAVATVPAVTEPAFLTTTRAAYDTVAVDYGEHFRGELETKPLDRAFLAGFAESVLAAGGGQVADVGCGTGQVTAYLRDLGLDVFGIDLSPGMLDVARRIRPGLRFVEGTMTDLDLSDGGLAGLSAYYSTIHVPDDRLPDVFAEFRRVLVPGGHLMLAFQVGDGPQHRAEAFGHEVALDFYLRRPDHVADLLSAAGVPVIVRLLREPDEVETTPRAYLLACKPSTGTDGLPTGAQLAAPAHRA
jgi:SAM-dependent methyltransferase